MVRLIGRYKLEELRLARLQLKYIDLNLCNEIKKYYTIAKKSYMVKTMSRSSTIFPFFKNIVVYIYNGKKYFPFLANNDLLGHKLGEFIFTRKFAGHKKQGKRLMFKKKIISSGQVYKHSVKVKGNYLMYKKLYKIL